MIELSDVFSLFTDGVIIGLLLSMGFGLIGTGLNSMMRIFTAEDLDK